MIETYKLLKRTQTTKNLANLGESWNKRRYWGWSLLR